MTVTLNEAALVRLLESEQGRVAQIVREKADEVQTAAQLNVDAIMADSFVRPKVEQARGEGLGIVLGLRDEGRAARYLDAKAARERGTLGDWMRRALAEVFPLG